MLAEYPPDSAFPLPSLHPVACHCVSPTQPVWTYLVQTAQGPDMTPLSQRTSVHWLSLFHEAISLRNRWTKMHFCIHLWRKDIHLSWRKIIGMLLFSKKCSLLWLNLQILASKRSPKSQLQQSKTKTHTIQVYPSFKSHILDPYHYPLLFFLNYIGNVMPSLCCVSLCPVA